LVCKGAIEEVLSLCSLADENGGAPGGVVPLTEAMRQQVRQITRDLNEDGLRAVAVAYKELPVEVRAYTLADEKDLTLAGYVAFLDPPKETARDAIGALGEYGVTVKIITGDNEIVTRKICKEVGLAVDCAMMGKEVCSLTDAELAEAAERTTIFTKMAPLDKSRVIRALQSKGHTVGYLGDGINDAAALKDADVGISVDTAVDIAKESADIILLEKSLLVLEEAVIEGRRTFANITKYIKMTASSNFGNVFSVLVASLFLPFLPMLPIQLLIQNFLYDISQISIPWDDVDQDYLKQPRKWDATGIARFMGCIGPISSIFDIVTFVVMWHVFGANAIEKQPLFQSGWFVVGLLTQTLIVHMIRTQHIPFIQSRAATPVLLLTVSIMAIGIYLPFSPLGAHVGMVPLPVSYFPWLVGILLSYCLLTQLVKTWYIRRYHAWL
jgi:Mg2+-importing ATPase